jgi:hypothetical protein
MGWIEEGFDRGIVLQLLKVFHSDSIASVTGVMALLAMADVGQRRRKLIRNLKVLAERGYVQLHTAAEFPKHLDSAGAAPDAVVGVRILPKGLSWADGEYSDDPKVLR